MKIKSFTLQIYNSSMHFERNEANVFSSVVLEEIRYLHMYTL